MSNFFLDPVAPSFKFFESLSTGAQLHGGKKNLQFSTEIAVYLGNGTNAHGCMEH